MSDQEWEEQVAAGGAVLRDADCLLRARQRLDGLTLDVLTAPGRADVQVAALSNFLATDWALAGDVADRFVCGSPGPGKPARC